MAVFWNGKRVFVSDCWVLWRELCSVPFELKIVCSTTCSTTPADTALCTDPLFPYLVLFPSDVPQGLTFSHDSQQFDKQSTHNDSDKNISSQIYDISNDMIALTSQHQACVKLVCDAWAVALMSRLTFITGSPVCGCFSMISRHRPTASGGKWWHRKSFLSSQWWSGNRYVPGVWLTIKASGDI